MKRVIVTGATSFIGRHLVRQLLERNWEVYAVIRPESLKRELLPAGGRIHDVELKMENYAALSSEIGGACDAYVSLAWNGTRGQERLDNERQRENFLYSMAALEEAAKLKCKVVISAGSQAEYGPMCTQVNEEETCRPNTAYGEWKLKFYEEGMAFCRKNHMVFKEPRFFSLYGEDDYERTMIMSVLQAMRENRPCRLTKCIQLWNFLHIDDAVDGIIRLLEMESPDGVYNFGSDDTRVLKDFIMEMYRLSGSKSELLFGAVPYPDTGMVNVWPNISRLKKETGWEPRIEFSEGIRRILEYQSEKGMTR